LSAGTDTRRRPGPFERGGAACFRRALCDRQAVRFLIRRLDHKAAQRPQPSTWRSYIASNEPRVNEQIRLSPVRLIDTDGAQLGVVPVDEAMTAAREKGLDLVEVAPNARPPVCRIMDYGRYKYEQAKAEREARRKQHVTQMKEIKMRPNIEEHDFEFKTRHIKRFLQDRDKVKVTIMFRGREMAHTENGKEVLDDVVEEIGDLAVVEQQVRLEGRNMFLILAPNTRK
jgi:translation initiation factor IF-3